MKGNVDCKNLRFLIGILPMLVVMVVIFVFSHRAGDASSEQSNAVGEWALGILGIEISPGQSASDVDIFWGFTIRKCAHIFLYLLLGASAFLFASCLPFRVEHLWRPVVCAGGAVAIAFLYACLDELHQAFVAGRGRRSALCWRRFCVWRSGISFYSFAEKGRGRAESSAPFFFSARPFCENCRPTPRNLRLSTAD